MGSAESPNSAEPHDRGFLTNFGLATKRVTLAIIPDLRSFTLPQGIFLVLFIATSLTFSFVDFQHFVDPENYPFVSSIQNDRLWGLAEWRIALMCLSGAASFTGVLSVVLTSKGKISLFFWGVINCICYGMFACAYGYAGDTLLNLVFFLPLQFVGLYMWSMEMDKVDTAVSAKDIEIAVVGEVQSQTAVSRRLSNAGRVGALLVAAVFTVAFWFVIPPFAVAIAGEYFFEGMTEPRLIDAIVSGLSVVAQVLLLMQYEEQWVLWITVDILSIIQWSGIWDLPFDINALVMWSFFLINAIWGYYSWTTRRVLREQASTRA